MENCGTFSILGFVLFIMVISIWDYYVLIFVVAYFLALWATWRSDNDERHYNETIAHFMFPEIPELEQIIIQINYQVYEYNDNDSPNKELDEICCICLDNLYITDISIAVLDCNHEFHKKCLEKWLEIKQICPLCIYEIPVTILHQSDIENEIIV